MSRFVAFAVAALGVVAGVAGPATADVTVWFDAQDSVITEVGGTTDVELWGSFTDPVVAWGLDVTIVDPTVVDLRAVLIGARWDGSTTLDDDGLAGLRFPQGVTGDVLLGTLTFTGLRVGMSDLTLGYGDEDEGFQLEFGGLDTSVVYVPGTISVVPEPGALSLLALGGLALLRRR